MPQNCSVADLAQDQLIAPISSFRSETIIFETAPIGTSGSGTPNAGCLADVGSRGWWSRSVGLPRVVRYQGSVLVRRFKMQPSGSRVSVMAERSVTRLVRLWSLLSFIFEAVDEVGGESGIALGVLEAFANFGSSIPRR